MNQLTGKKSGPDLQGDATLKEFETSVKFAGTFIFALFTSGIGGYYACKLVFGLDHETVR